MPRLCLILGDQLTPGLSALRSIDPDCDVVVMAEVAAEADYAPHHRQKLVLFFAAMRHFAAGLTAQGFTVRYTRLDDPGNSGTLVGEVARAAKATGATGVIVTAPGEWRLAAEMAGWPDALGLPVQVVEDDRFFCDHATFAAFARGRKTLLMEAFYRQMRAATGYLMADGEPVGGKWNLDHENRARLPKGAKLPRRLRFDPDAVTQEVIGMVDRLYPDRWGALADFGWPVTRADALAALAHFIDEILPEFGTYQDAMATDAPYLYHSLLAAALNLGLLLPREVCDAAAAAYASGHAPLNAVEGFIRQILGWREFIRGVYFQYMPEYATRNALGADRPLPAFYWTTETKMHCVAQTVAATRDNAYAHHIQRLMITGNFALLAGIDPRAVNAWYLGVYADAVEWVQLPNTQGMALWADGGLVGTKPYAASGAYIHRMSDYCGTCHYNVREKTGPRACPFNFLYWDFLDRNAERLAGNVRLALPLKALAAKSPAERAAIRASAKDFLDRAVPMGAARP